MDNSRRGITRRDFLHGAAGVTLLSSAEMTVSCQKTEQSKDVALAAQKSKVVLVRDADAVDTNGRRNAKVLQRMLDDAVTALVGEADPIAAWKRLVRASDIVGIKSNVWRFLPTPAELEAAIKRRLIGAGVSEDLISIDDRGVLRNPIFQKATALINIRPMHTHYWSGVGGCIKNYIMFSPNPPGWHGDSCANLAGLWDLPVVKGKTRLNILVMLTPLFHSKGPHSFQKRYTWEYKGLVVGTDPVSVDATGVRIFRAKRLAFFGEDQPFSTSPKHIQVAEQKFRLGIADAERIELQKLGWMDDVLI